MFPECVDGESRARLAFAVCRLHLAFLRLSWTCCGQRGMIAYGCDERRAGVDSINVKWTYDRHEILADGIVHGVTRRIEGMAGAELSLSPIQMRGSDPVVKETRWDAANGSVTIPGRTVAAGRTVAVLEQLAR